MRHVFGMASCGLALVLSLVACGGEDVSGARKGADGPNAPGANQPGATTPGVDATPAPACPTGLAQPQQLATDAADDLAVVGDKVYFRVSNELSSMAKDGTGRASVYKDPNLYHTYVDASGILAVTAPDAPDATLVYMGLDGKAIFTVNPTTPWNAADTRVFGSDATSLYVLTDVDDQGATIYSVDKATGTQTMLANFGVGEGNDISDPLLAGENVWFVRASKRVYEVVQTSDATDNGDGTDKQGDPTGALPGDPRAALTAQPATEIFASASETCHLAVKDYAFCANGAELIRRDLQGANPTTVFDASKDGGSSLGSIFFQSDVLWTRPASANDVQTDPLKGVIRSLTTSGSTASEKIVACGRGTIASVAVDTGSVFWSESGATSGVFLAPR